MMAFVIGLEVAFLRVEMKPLLTSLIKRNALITSALVLLLTSLRLLPDRYPPPWVFLVIFFGGLFWANSILIKRGRPLSAVLLSLLLVPILGVPAGIASFVLSLSLVEWEYKTRGLQIVYGCNALVAETAYFDEFMVNERLTELTNSPHADTSQMTRLREAYATAQERVRILNEDCRRRGHCNSHLWKTNWVTIKEALAANDRGWRE